MKRILCLIMAMVLCLSITGCGSKNYQDVLSEYYKTTLSDFSDEDKIKISNDMIDILFNDKEINGIYYYNEVFSPGTMGEKWYGSHSQDTIFALFVSPEEVYFVPHSVVNTTNIEDIEKIENKSEYQYRIESAELKKDGFQFNLLRTTDSFDISLLYRNGDSLYIYDHFPHLFDENGEETHSSCREYFRSESRSIDSADDTVVARANKESKERAEKNALKNSEPKIGMTADQVKQCKWGYPNKINKDVTASGTSEQWIYNSYGYVYLKNGVVTSVSYR